MGIFVCMVVTFVSIKCIICTELVTAKVLWCVCGCQKVLLEAINECAKRCKNFLSIAACTHFRSVVGFTLKKVHDVVGG